MAVIHICPMSLLARRRGDVEQKTGNDGKGFKENQFFCCSNRIEQNDGQGNYSTSIMKLVNKDYIMVKHFKWL